MYRYCRRLGRKLVLNERKGDLDKDLNKYFKKENLRQTTVITVDNCNLN